MKGRRLKFICLISVLSIKWSWVFRCFFFFLIILKRKNKFVFCFGFFFKKNILVFFLLICSKSQILHSNRPDHGVNANPETPMD